MKGQKVITTGPYAIVRHPMYLGVLFVPIYLVNEGSTLEVIGNAYPGEMFMLGGMMQGIAVNMQEGNVTNAKNNFNAFSAPAGNISWPAAKTIFVASSFDGATINLADERWDAANRSVELYLTNVTDACKICHTTERKYFVSADVIGINVCGVT